MTARPDPERELLGAASGKRRAVVTLGRAVAELVSTACWRVTLGGAGTEAAFRSVAELVLTLKPDSGCNIRSAWAALQCFPDSLIETETKIGCSRENPRASEKVEAGESGEGNIRKVNKKQIFRPVSLRWIKEMDQPLQPAGDLFARALFAP